MFENLTEKLNSTFKHLKGHGKLSEKNIDYVVNLISKLRHSIFAFLIDNSEGHGNKLDIGAVKDLFGRVKGIKIILAGGIDVSNIEKILRTIKPFGIDVSSSLESSKGVKDPKKIVEFMNKVNSIKNSGV